MQTILLGSGTGTMRDLHISATHTVASILWVAGMALVVVDVFVAQRLGPLGVMLGVGGATLTVRGWMWDLQCREVDAFRRGREMRSVK